MADPRIRIVLGQCIDEVGQYILGSSKHDVLLLRKERPRRLRSRGHQIATKSWDLRWRQPVVRSLLGFYVFPGKTDLLSPGDMLNRLFYKSIHCKFRYLLPALENGN